MVRINKVTFIFQGEGVSIKIRFRPPFAKRPTAARSGPKKTRAEFPEPVPETQPDPERLLPPIRCQTRSGRPCPCCSTRYEKAGALWLLK